MIAQTETCWNVNSKEDLLVLGWFVSAMTLLAVHRWWGYAPSNAVSHPKRLELQQHGCEHLRMLGYHWSQYASSEPVLLVLVMIGSFHLLAHFVREIPFIFDTFLVGLCADW